MKKRTRRNVSSRSATAAEVLDPVREVQPLRDQIRLNMEVTPGDLADMIKKIVRTDARENLVAQRTAISEELSEAQRQHSTIAKQLETQSMEAVQALVQDEAAVALASALTKFTGDGYLVCTSDVRADVGTMTLTADVDVITAKAANARQNTNRSSHYGCGHEISKRGTVPFTPAMRETVVQLQEAADAVREIEARRAKVDRMLSDLPSLMEKAESEMLKTYMPENLLGITDRVQRKLRGLPAPKKE